MEFGKIMLMMGALATYDQLINTLEKSIKKYREASDEDKEEAKIQVELSCSLLLSKAVAPDMESAQKLSAEFDDREDDLKVQDLLDKTINKDKK